MGKGKGIGKPTPQQSISVPMNAELAFLRTDVKDCFFDVFADRLRGPFPVCGFSGFRHAADPHRSLRFSLGSVVVFFFVGR